MNTLASQIKDLAEDCAYTFKGLYKQSDILEKYNKLLILAPIIFSILFLVFPNLSDLFFGKILAIIALVFSIILLIEKNDSDQIIRYRGLANDYKSLYDELYLLHSKDDVEHRTIKEICERKNELNKQTSQCSIGWIAKRWTKICINEEMNIDWLKKTV